jgi:hypothetical protein
MASIADRRYLSICYRPRATIRAIVSEDPRQRVILLVLIPSVLGGLSILLATHSIALAMKASTAAGPKMGLRFLKPFGRVMLVALPVIALSTLYLDGALIRWLGAKMGGSASAVEIRAAVGWSRVPVIAFGGVNLALAALGIGEPPATYFVYPSILRTWVSPRGLASLSLFAWTVVLECQCISELHGISAMRAFAAWAIAKFTEVVLFAGSLVLLLVIVLVLIRFSSG